MAIIVRDLVMLGPEKFGVLVPQDHLTEAIDVSTD